MSPTSINKKLIIYMFYSKITNPTTQHPTGTILNCFMITCSHSQHSVNVQKTRWLFINIQQRTQTLTKCLRRLTSRRTEKLHICQHNTTDEQTTERICAGH